MRSKKRIKKKVKSSFLKKSKKIDLRDQFEADAGKGTEGFNKIVRVNMYEEAAKVKTFKGLEYFIEMYMPGLSVSDVARAAVNLVKDHKLKYLMLQNPEYHGSFFQLLDAIDKTSGGALAIYESKVLDDFCYETGYKKPNTAKTFQNEIHAIKKYFGLERKKTGEYSRKQLEKVAAKVAAKLARKNN